jgi:hypothetical protein
MQKEMVNYKKKLKSQIEVLSEEKLKLISNFVDFIENKECWEETKQILLNKRLMNDIKKADRDLKENKLDEFMVWDKIKEDV